MRCDGCGAEGRDARWYRFGQAVLCPECQPRVRRWIDGLRDPADEPVVRRWQDALTAEAWTQARRSTAEVRA